jgi:hypothetical protein
MIQAMKKLFSISAVLLLAVFSVQAQADRPAPATDNAPASVHDRSGSQFIAAAMRVRANITPNPVSERGIVDASGAVIRHIVVRNADGRELRRHSPVDAIRFALERPGLSPGLHLVDVYTDFGKGTIKVMIQ